VVTAGGIYGTIRSVENTYFLIEVANGVRIRVDKGSVYPSAEEANAGMAQNENKDGK
ncbi:MAG: preprotein translocase subunit YajC, partial [Muribaculaceae bacterium]|nr:preprotein translocase subunit YajC [Muribaculaceae bacterium]